MAGERPTPPPSPYIPNTDDDRAAMLRAIGVDSFAELVADIPRAHRAPRMKLPPPMPELAVAREVSALAARNRSAERYACFLGGGAYRHFIPAAVRQIASRGEFVTSYTPYQAEVSQGSLQAAFEFQTLVCLLFDMEVANAGMYDGPTAFAEGALMACRITRRHRVAVLDSVAGRILDVIRSYTRAQGVELVLTPASAPEVPDDAACLMAQSPNALGIIEDLTALSELAHARGALLAASVNPLSTALFKPPGQCGVDIATGEGQPLGVPLSFGGPYVGLLACRDAHRRQMPGRVVGRTTDTRGRAGYVLTLQTREQHIRRERATSNICTSTQLVALMTTAYLAAMGKRGLREVAELCYHKAHYAAAEIASLPCYSLPVPGVYFHEFAVSCPKPPRAINDALLERGIIGGLDVSDRVDNGMLFCVTEMNTRAEIDRLVAALAEIGGGS